MLNVGDPAPDFNLLDDAGQTVTLDALLTGGALVLYFYPADFTPICTAEACMFRDAGVTLAEAGVRVVGVSPQGQSTHESFKRKHRLNFTLLSDPGRKAAAAYGAVGFMGLPVPFITRRVTFLISRDKRIIDRANGDISVSAHEAFVQRVLTKLATDKDPAAVTAESRRV